MIIKPKWAKKTASMSDSILLNYILHDGSTLIIFKSTTSRLGRQQQLKNVKNSIRGLEHFWKEFQKTGAFDPSSRIIYEDEYGMQSERSDSCQAIYDACLTEQKQGDQGYVAIVELRDFIAEALRRDHYKSYIPIVFEERRK